MPSLEKPDILTVSQLTRRVKQLLETQVSYVWISGEISNWRVSPAGHAYGTLKDDKSQIDVVMFRGKLMRLQFEPGDGLEVIAHGLVTVYERRGNYQLVVEEMHPKGVGALQLAFEKLRKKLEQEGLFDDEHKKPLPMLPRRIGVVTSPTGAAIRDILNVINRRFANVHVILYPARVQGDEAAPEIIEGIRVLEAYGVDVMIVGRGGGSLEDLWPFNEEMVVRAVHAAKTPIISAVGHEIDVALTDLAADVRAPTPSAAAELVVKERQALAGHVTRLRRQLASCLERRVESARNRLSLAQSSFVFRRPEELLRQWRQLVDDLRARMETGQRGLVGRMRQRIDGARRELALLSPVNQVRRAKERLQTLRGRLSHGGVTNVERMRARLGPNLARLNALSPLGVLARGYALAWKLPERTLVRSARQLAPKDEVELRFGEGVASAIVKSVNNPEEETADG